MVPPVIRDVALHLARSGAESSGLIPLREAHVTFWTGRHSESVPASLEYGPTPAYGSTVGPDAGGPLHHLVIPDLTPGARVHFRVKAGAGADEALGQDHAFTATPGVVPPGPTIVHQPLTGLTATGATINWSTNPAAPPGRVDYSTDPNLSPKLTKAETAGADRTNHAAPLTGLTTRTLYYYRVTQASAAGGSTTTSLRTFVTP